MAKISLAEKLQSENVLKSHLIVSSRLIEKLEVYGYVNSCQGNEMMLEDIRINNITTVGYNNFINCQTAGEIVCSNYMMQPVMLSHKNEMRLHQIYSILEISKESFILNLADLDIPSLFYNPIYKKIRRRDKNKSLSSSEIKYAKFPENIKQNSDKRFDYTSNPRDVLCRDKDGSIKSIGDHLMAVCRYLFPQTGMMCYTQLDLDELFWEE